MTRVWHRRVIELAARALGPLAVLALLTAASPAALAHPVLTLSVSEHSVSITPGGKAAPPDETFPITVTLGHTFLSFEHHGKRYIEDFATGRAYALSLATQTYEEDSLYSNIGFRVHELENRMYLGRLLTAAKIDTDHFVPAILENEFAIEIPGANTAIDADAKGDERSFRWKGRELLALSRASLPVPKAYAGEYWRFLRYFTGGHPKIFRELAGYEGVPRQLRIHISNVYEVTRTIRVTGIELRADESYSLAAATRAPSSTEPGKTLATLAAEGPAGVAAAVVVTKAERDAFLAEGKMLEAFLRHLSVVIENGDTSPDWLLANRARVQGDPDVARVAGALNPASAAEAEKAVKTLEELRDVDPAGRYLLNVFRGNILSNLGRTQAGIESLLAALRVNPHLTGAWIDLGGMYNTAYDPVLAWACWDTARRLAPSHLGLKVADDLERKLRTEHPEFF